MESFLLVAGILRGLYCLLLFLTAVFLILLVLIQRGRGGGLAGAFGGMGGQSAFGTKDGDTFTKVTIVAATFWIVLCILGVKYGAESDSKMAAGPAISTPAGSEDQPPLDTTDLDASTPTSEPAGEAAASPSAASPEVSSPDDDFPPSPAPEADQSPNP